MANDLFFDTIADRLHFSDFPDYYFEVFLYIYTQNHPYAETKTYSQKTVALAKQIMAFEKDKDARLTIEAQKILLVMLGNTLANAYTRYTKEGEASFKINNKQHFFAQAKAVFERFENLCQSKEYVWAKSQQNALKGLLATDKTKGDVKYLTTLFEQSKNAQKLAESLFDIFYSNEKNSRDLYNSMGGLTSFDLLFKEKPKFHSWRFENGTLLLCGYRIYYGVAIDDYIDPVVSINDYRIIHIAHRADRQQTEKIFQHKMAKAFGSQYQKELEKAKQTHAQKVLKEYGNGMSLD